MQAVIAMIILLSSPANMSITASIDKKTSEDPKSSFATIIIIGIVYSSVMPRSLKFKSVLLNFESFFAVRSMNMGFTNSDGCTVVTPKFIQAREPFITSPRTGI